MNYFVNGTNVVVENSFKINLDQTFNCGQCFRWNKQSDGSFVGVVGARVIKVKQRANTIIFENTTKETFENMWVNYFDLNLNYDQIRENIRSINKTLKDATDFAPGIRILTQDPWETLCSFIISQNNNIKRIKGIVERLCENFGTEIKKGTFSFPDAGALAQLSEDDLAPIKCGFRSKYIVDAAQKVCAGEVDLEKIKQLDLEKARLELMKIKGVGSKVAECVLLYGLHRLDAFPVDVWIKRAMSEYFPGYTPEDFGKYAGIAQQYIFHYVRTKQN